MLRIRPLLSTLAVGLAFALLPTAAQASYDPSGFRFSAENYTVHEYSGYATVTVTRSDTSQVGHADYIAVGMGHPCGSTSCTATAPQDQYDVPADFGATKGELDFPVGAASESFRVPIIDHHFATITKTVSVGIFASWPQGTANPDHAVITILGDDPTTPRDPNNPLELPVAPTNGNPLSGATFFVDHQDDPWHFVGQYPALRTIADQPGAARFGTFSGADVGLAVNRYLVRQSAEAPGTVPLLATYRIVDGHCHNWTPTAANVADYESFINRFAQGIGSHRGVLFLEMDSLITVGCLTPQGVNIRMAELHYAVDTLTADCPHLVVYLDAGAGDALSASRAAALLRQAGVSQIQGFFLNSTHFDWTSKEIWFGEHVSKLLGGAHFVVNTGDAGRGPLVPPDRVHEGNEVLCNPAGRGLGPKPTTNTGYVNVDAFEWTTNPGESGGACVPGAPATGVYWPAYALMLIRNADYAVDSTYNLNAWATNPSARTTSVHHKKKRHKKAKPHPKPRHTFNLGLRLAASGGSGAAWSPGQPRFFAHMA